MCVLLVFLYVRNNSLSNCLTGDGFYKSGQVVSDKTATCEWLCNLSRWLSGRYWPPEDKGRFRNRRFGFSTVANYIGWSMVKSMTSMMSTPFRRAASRLKKRLYKIHSDQPRWEYCTGLTESEVGFATGALFVEKYFSATDRSNVRWPVQPWYGQNLTFSVIVNNSTTTSWIV